MTRGNHQGSRSIIRSKTASCLLLATLGVAAAAPALAQSATGTSVNTAPTADPRRQGGAVITQQPATSTSMDAVKDSEDMQETYQPKGIRLGSFLLLPKVELDTVYNDNIFAEENGTNSDFITTLRPEFRLRSQFPVHSFNLSGQLEANRYAEYTDDNTINGRLTADGRYDLTTTSELTALIDLNLNHEERGSDDAVNGREPTETRSALGRIGGKTQMGSFTYSLDGTADRRQFEDAETSTGVRINNTDRNRTELSTTARAAYEMFPGYAAVVALTGNRRIYDSDRDDNGFNRDSYGYRVEGGLGLDISQLVRGDFLIGYMGQHYEDRGLKDPKGLAVRATLNWTPSRMTLIVPALERSVQETTLNRSSGTVRSSASVLVRHELARNILVTGYAGLYHDDYTSLNQDALTYELRARLTYAFSANVYVSGELSHKSKDSDQPNRSYDQNFIGLRLGLQM